MPQSRPRLSTRVYQHPRRLPVRLSDWLRATLRREEVREKELDYSNLENQSLATLRHFGLVFILIVDLQVRECLRGHHRHSQRHHHQPLLPGHLPQQQELHLGDHSPTPVEVRERKRKVSLLVIIIINHDSK